MAVSVSSFLEGVSVMTTVCEYVFDRYFFSGKARTRHTVRTFESQLSGMLHQQSVVGTSSGTDALILSLRALTVGVGDEVIVPGYGCPAIPAAVSWTGAVPVFVDVAVTDHALVPDAVRGAITERTKAVVFAHHFGMPSARIHEVRTVADGHGLTLIEDVAQVFGGSVDGPDQAVPVGTVGRLACMSFTTGKPLATFGSAGAVSGQEEPLLETIRTMATYGARIPYEAYPVVGVNARLDPIHAGILTAKLKYFDRRSAGWRRNAAHYEELLDGIPEVTLPKLPSGDRFSYPEYVVQVQARDALTEHLAGLFRGRGPAPHAAYPVALCDLPVYGRRGESGCATARMLAQTSLALPLSLSSGGVQRVAGAIRSFYRGA